MTDQPDDKKVGYGRPPKHSQFQPGETGNPKGRPKGSRNLRTDVKRALKKPVSFIENGKRKTTSTQEAAILKLRETALNGNPRALDKLVDLAARFNDDPPPPAADEPLSAEDEAIIAEYLASQPPPNVEPPPALPATEQGSNSTRRRKKKSGPSA